MELYIPFFAQSNDIEFEDISGWEVVDPKKYSIRTGDILLFSGSSFLSSGIKLFTTSIWCHVGIACWVKLYKNDGSTEVDLFCFELGSNNYTDLISREIMDKRVRLVRIGDIAIMYDIIAVRRLKFERKFSFPSDFKEFMIKWNGMAFPDFINLINAFMLNSGYSSKRVTCAHLIATFMDHFNIHKLNFDPSQLSPNHYSGSSRAFPEDIFRDDAEITIYKDDHWANMRVFYAFVFVIIIIVLVLFYFKRKQNKD